MSAIYQRARPINWEQVVGQEHVKDVLRAALERGRLGHAYLFSGPRGVGKTTVARLIAMTANCESSGVKPCGVCPSCLAVRAGSHPDVTEIDAASNNSVDDVRELREKVGLSSMRGGKKIYILDEAHMMSRAAFNALLKTLEEPPEHVIFILATTEPEKVLPTILSRCQHYRFRRLTDAEIAGKLAGICAAEGTPAEPEALALIGRLADGAMRDGESLLERMLAAGGGVSKAGVEEALGLPPGERVAHMAAALVGGDAAGLMAGAGQLYRDGYAARTVVEGLVTALRDALHAELGLAGGARIEGADVPRLLKLQAALDEQESRFSRHADLLSLELALTHALMAGESGGVSTAGAPAGTALPADLGARLNKIERELSGLKAGGVAPTNAPAEVPDFDPGARRPAPARAEGPVQKISAPAPASGSWADVVKQASMQVRAFLKPARMHAEAGYISLTYDERSKFHARSMMEKFDEVAALALKVFGPVTFELHSPEGNKRAQLGGSGRGGNEGGGTVPDDPGPGRPPPTPVAAQSAPTAEEPTPTPRPAPARPPAEPPPFNPGGRMEARAATASATATLDEPPPFNATRSARPAPTPAPPVAHSPDDDAPAPLPDRQPMPSDEVQARTVYLEPEPISVEPSWDTLGYDDAPSASAPAAEVSAPPTAPTRLPKSNTKGGGIRAHPLFEDAARRFGGRVKEIGQLRVSPATVPDAAAEVEPAGDEADVSELG